LGVGLAVLVVGRCFQYARPIFPAEWLTVALTAVLVDSAFPAFRPNHVASMDEEVVWVYWLSNGPPVAFYLWTPHTAECRDYLAGVSFQLIMAATLIATAGLVLRRKISRGWVAVLLIAIAILVTLGPIRLVEALSTEVSSSATHTFYQPRPDEVPWSRMGLSLYLDARAWAGYSIRALVISAVAIVAVASLVTRGLRRIWTEWMSFAVAFVLGCCWAYDEFASRPAFDRTARVVALGTWLIVVASLAGTLIAASAAFRQRILRLDATNRHGVPTIT
jgi:hypothetical protein